MEKNNENSKVLHINDVPSYKEYTEEEYAAARKKLMEILPDEIKKKIGLTA